MSDDKWNLIDEAEQWITCPYCGAKAKFRCRTSGGRFTTPHSARTQPITNAYREGWTDGFRDGELIGRQKKARS